MNWMYICEHDGCRVITYHGVHCPSCGLVGRAIIIAESETTPTERPVTAEERIDPVGDCRFWQVDGCGRSLCRRASGGERLCDHDG